ncbi:HNH endonuclease [Pedobacter sp. AW1-32]|uniref:HNH endonuclease n=1 Tax=Pedobacter sp. AW1-32 TaxID=3383026 RepID=UPI003FEF7ECE
MKGSYLNKILSINAKHALYREDGKWYHNLTKFPGVLFDKNGYIIFNNEESYINNPKLQVKKDLHITDGIESLANYVKFSKRERELINIIDFVAEDNEEHTIRVIREIEIILRKRNLVEKIKKLYNSTCQLCDTQVVIGDKKYYSEIHHIIPLGKPHNGIDALENMVCVCPNCHIELDFKAIPLNENMFKVIRHTISSKSIKYHNSLYKIKKDSSK